jgi:hypothetical protein
MTLLLLGVLPLLGVISYLWKELRNEERFCEDHRGHKAGEKFC